MIKLFGSLESGQVLEEEFIIQNKKLTMIISVAQIMVHYLPPKTKMLRLHPSLIKLHTSDSQ